MDTDIIIYAVIALVIFARLWIVLGRRDADDRQRPNPFAASAPPAAQTSTEDENGLNPHAGPELPPVYRPSLLAPASLAGGLEQIKQADPRFDEKQFLQDVRTTFALILDEFAKGELTRSTRFLGPNVLPHFQAAITARRTAGQIMENRLERIKDVETVSARLANGKAAITVRFISEQQHVMRDAHGAVIAGEEGRIEEITDLWTFAHDMASSDSSWILVETKS